MNIARRILTVVGLTAAVTIPGALPASATFSDTVAVSTAVGTLTVAAPTDARLTTIRCHPAFGVETTVTWRASTTARGVIGYRVMGHLNTGASLVVGETDAATTSLNVTFDQYYLQFEPRVSVITLTSYGWTAESARSAVATC